MSLGFPMRLPRRCAFRPAAVDASAKTERRDGSRPPGILLIGFSFLVLVLFLLLVAGSLYQKRAQALGEAARTTHNLVRTLDEHASRSIRGVEIALEALSSRLDRRLAEGPLDPQWVKELLAPRFKPGVQFTELFVLDASGRPIADPASGVARKAASERDFFIEPRDHPTAEFYVSRPFVSEATKLWSIAVSRPLHKPDGSFGGVVVAAINLGVFESFYASLDLGPHGNVTLWDGTGRSVLARYPRDARLFAQSFPRGPLFERITRGDFEGTFQSVSPLDGIDRILSFRRVSDLPLVVSVGLAAQDALAMWRRDLWTYGIGAAIGAAVLVALTGLLLRQFARLRASEAALRTSEQRFRDFAETASDWYWELDADYRFTYNSSRAQALGFDLQRLTGRRPEEVASDFTTDSERWREHLALRERHEPFSDFVFAYQVGTAETRYSSVSGKPLFDAAGRFCGYRGSCRDVTEQRRVQAHLLEAKGNAEAANRAKSQFLAGVGHELRTPLNAIIGFSQLLLSEVLGKPANPKAQDYIRDIHTSGQHLLALINDILEVARIETGEVELHEEEVDIDELVASCLRLVDKRAIEGGVRLQTGSLGGLPRLTADRTRLKQILLNLLSNAVKFTPRGGTVALDAGLDASGDMVIAVRDTGIGMSEAEIAIARQAFRQVDGSLGRRYEGTGLGLALTEAFIAAHDGRLVIESAPGQGTTVRVVLPAARVRATSGGPRAA